MTCARFRETLGLSEPSAEMLAHMRACSSCLEAAVATNPDNLFRSLGSELIPPGGIDPFVNEVMQQVQLRKTEGFLRTRARFPMVYRWSVAAMLAVVVLTAALLRRTGESPAMVSVRPAPIASVAQASLPVVESYEEASAMIVELSAEQTGDLKVVMIFDETLPADI